MATLNTASKRLKLKGTTFQSVANGTTQIDIQQPGDCNTILGINIYSKDDNNTVANTFSFTVNSTVLAENISAIECNPAFNNSYKPFLELNFPLAGSDAIKLSWTDTQAASYIINIYYYY
jgi:hypothetical protein